MGSGAPYPGTRIRRQEEEEESALGARWTVSERENHLRGGGGRARGQVGRVCGQEPDAGGVGEEAAAATRGARCTASARGWARPEGAARRAAGARSEDVTSGGSPLPGEGRGLRLVQPGGRKEGEERRRPSGRATGAAGVAPGRRGRPSASSRLGPGAGAAVGRVRGLRAAAQRLCSVLQVYPEPRSESECLSNIREFLRGCGASLRLEVSGQRVRGAAWGGGRLAGGTARSLGARRPGSPAPPGCERAPRAGRSRRVAAPGLALATVRKSPSGSWAGGPHWRHCVCSLIPWSPPSLELCF